MLRMKFQRILAVLFTLCLLPLCALAQGKNAAPTPDQLHQFLDISHRRSLLIAENAAPFHLAATIDLYKDGQPAGSATLDELWRDPLSWKLAITNAGSTFTEVNNGADAWATGDALPNAIVRAEAALFSPYRPILLSSHRLTPEPKHNGLLNLDCIGAEPEIPGLPSGTSLADTTYCLAQGNRILRYIDYPNGYIVNLNDVAPFGTKYIARTIDVSLNGQPIARLHVTTLPSSPQGHNDFAALSAPATANAKPGKAHSQEALLADEIMRGQLVYSTTPRFDPHLAARHDGTVILTVHVDATGKVTGSDVVRTTNSIMTHASTEAVKQLEVPRRLSRRPHRSRGSRRNHRLRHAAVVLPVNRVHFALSLRSR